MSLPRSLAPADRPAIPITSAPGHRPGASRRGRLGRVPTDDLDTFRRWQATRDPAVRDELVMRHIGLAHAMAHRYVFRGMDAEDLRQVAVIGLIKAIDRFDPDHGTAFSSFAVPTILGEVKRHFRDRGWTIRVPRRLQELRRRVEQSRRRLEQEHARVPSPSEIARDLDEPVRDVLEAMAIGSCYQPSSLDVGLRPDVADGSSGAADTACDRAEVARFLGRLPERDRRIFVLRYYAGMTQQEIADRVGISQMHVSRRLRAGIRDLRDAVA